MKQNLQRAYIIGPIIIFVVLVVIFTSIDKDNLDQMYSQEKQIEEVIRKYAVACYAQEGAYPRDLTYLEENYGLIIDEDKYFYYYDLFASNILPDIEVKTIEGGR